jgi:iron(III)-enterobactin esterase
MTARPSRLGVTFGALSALTLACGLACSSEPSPPSPGTGGTGAGTGGASSTGGAGTGGSSTAGSGGAGGSGGSAAGAAGSGTGGSSAGSGAAGGSATGGVAGSGGTAAGAAGASGGNDAGAAGGGGSPAGGTAGIGGMAAGAGGAGAGAAGSAGASGAGGLAALPDPGTEGDGDFMAGPNYPTASDLNAKGNPQGRNFSFSMPLAQSEIFDGTDPTLDAGKVNTTRSIQVYVPAQYQDGDPAPVLVIQDGPGQLGQVKNALDNLTISQDATRKLPPFVVIAVQNGGNDAIGSERGLEYDTMSDRYARFINVEVMPAVASNAQLKQAYPNFKFTQDPSGRAALGCSSGGAAAFTMAWFRPDLFSRVIAYSTTLVDQQDPDAPENAMFPDGAWDYHSDLKLIENKTEGRDKQIRVFLNVNQNDLRSGDAESTKHNWVMANQRTAAALKAKGFHYRFVLGQGAGHCDGGVINNTLADALVWAWRGYVPTGR